MIANDGALNLCLPTCHPLTPTCDPGEGCLPVHGGQAFVCVPAPSAQVEYEYTCAEFGGCEPGTVCTDAEALTDCVESACCTPYCNADAAESDCPLDTQCVPWVSDVGICATP
jgi:hypothetical protein